MIPQIPAKKHGGTSRDRNLQQRLQPPKDQIVRRVKSARPLQISSMSPLIRLYYIIHWYVWNAGIESNWSTQKGTMTLFADVK